MALADLITLLIGPWMLLVNDCYQNYVLGAFFCKIQGFIQGKKVTN